MSKSVSRNVICPDCGASVAAKMWTVVNTAQTPELRDKIMDESLFDWRCPNCRFQAQLISHCLYHDLENGFMVYLLPDFSDPKLEDGGVEAQYPEMAGLTKRVVPSLNKMKEKILIFEAGANDMAIELTKLAVEGIIEKKYDKKVLASYFLLMDSQEKTIGFSFFLEGRDEPVYYDTRLEVYEKCMDIIEDFAFEELHSPYFLLIDETWAKKTLDTYRNS